MPTNLKKLTVLPILGLAVGSLVLLGGALAGDGSLPESARSLTSIPNNSDRVAPAPEGLSSITVTRDWQEVRTSGSKRGPR